jgi:hypothetical protein
MGEIFSQVSLRDSGISVVELYSETKRGISFADISPSGFRKIYPNESARKLHDGNFAFVMSNLSKLHTKVYEPKWNTTYAQDVSVVIGGGLVDFVDFFSVEWSGMPTTAQNLTANNVNIIPRVNAKLNHEKVNVYNFEIAYDMKFIEIDKLNKVNFQKALDAIYKDAILAGWDIFCDKIIYEGADGTNGLLTSDSKVKVSVVPQGTADATQDGLKAMTDTEIVGLFNGILSYYLINSNNNINLLPDTFLLPTVDATELSSRFSTLYTATLREFLMNHNVGIDEAQAAGFNYKINIKGRSRLNGAGTLKAGRIVAYKKDEDFVRVDIPYPVQSYYTGPNIDKMCYSTYFVGQVSDVQLPYNKSANELGAVTYWDLTAKNA